MHPNIGNFDISIYRKFRYISKERTFHISKNRTFDVSKCRTFYLSNYRTCFSLHPRASPCFLNRYGTRAFMYQISKSYRSIFCWVGIVLKVDSCPISNTVQQHSYSQPWRNRIDRFFVGSGSYRSRFLFHIQHCATALVLAALGRVAFPCIHHWLPPSSILDPAINFYR